MKRLGGEIWGLSIVLSAAARLSLARGHYDQARAQASEVLSLSRQLEDPRGVAWSFEIFAGALAAEERGQDAARLWGVSDKLLEGVGGALSPEIRWIRDHYQGGVERSLGREVFTAACAAGRAMALDAAVALARDTNLPVRRHDLTPARADALLQADDQAGTRPGASRQRQVPRNRNRPSYRPRAGRGRSQ